MLLRMAPEPVFGLRVHIPRCPCTHIKSTAEFNQRQPQIAAHQARAREAAPRWYASVPGCRGRGERTLLCYMNFPLNYST